MKGKTSNTKTELPALKSRASTRNSGRQGTSPAVAKLSGTSLPNSPIMKPTEGRNSRKRRSSTERTEGLTVSAKKRTTGSESLALETNTSPSGTSAAPSIRTRLSTGSIHMNGTTTISTAKEKAELENLVKQFTKAEESTLPSKAINSKKRNAQVGGAVEIIGEHPPPKKRKIGRNDGSGEDNCNDYFCWLCHKEGSLVCCELCPRVYHTRCLRLTGDLPQDWVCPECEKIMRAECVDTRSKAMEMLTLEQLSTLLRYALERMKHAGSEPFQKPVDMATVPNYSDYIFNPMDLSMVEKNIKKKVYGCTEAFLADAKWIQHNCIIYNGAHSKLTSSAKMIIKICKHEMNEIELCPDCYLNSCIRKNDEWFSETCRKPHTLVWAKLKGYPFWPAKALREINGEVDVRFFGAHDRSWVPVSQCFLLSKNIPTSLKTGKKNAGLDGAIDELNLHISKLREQLGTFEYAPFRTPYDKTDSYKPINLKSPVSKPHQKMSTSLFASQKTISGMTKKSMTAKTASALKMKYSAFVNIKKLDSSPDKMKKVTVNLSPVDRDDKNKGVKKVTPQLKTPTADVETDSCEIGGKAVEVKAVSCETISESIVKTEPNAKSEPSLKESAGSSSSSSIVERLAEKIKAMSEAETDGDSTTQENSEQCIVKPADKTESERSEVTDSEKVESKKSDEIDGAKILKDVESVDKRIQDSEKETKDTQMDSGFQKEKSNKDNSGTLVENKIDLLKNTDVNVKKGEKEQESRDTDNSGKANSETEKTSRSVFLKKLEATISSCKATLGLDKSEESSDDSDSDTDSGDGEYEEEEDGSSNEHGSQSEEMDDNTKESDCEEILGKKAADRDSATGGVDEADKKSVNETDVTIAKDNLSESTKMEKNSLETNQNNGIENVKILEVKSIGNLDIDEEDTVTPVDMEARNKDHEKSVVKETPNVPLEKSVNMVENKDPVSKKDVTSKQLNQENVNSDNIVKDSGKGTSKSETTSLSVQNCSVKNDKPKSFPSDKPKSPEANKSQATEEVMVIDEHDDAERLVIDLDQEKPLAKAAGSKPGTVKSNFREKVAVEMVESGGVQVMTPVPTQKSPVASSEKLGSGTTETPSTSKSTSSSSIAEKFSKKLLLTIQQTFDEMCEEVRREQTSNSNSIDLRRALAQAKWDHSSELHELNHNFRLTISEMKSCWEAEKDHLIKTMTSKHKADLEKTVKETKKKQWCAFCEKEAIFYCCWNTSYCNYPCQQAHWPEHMHTCLQTNKDSDKSVEGTEEPTATTTDITPVSITTSIVTSASVSMSKEASPVVATNVTDIYRQHLHDNISAAIHREEERRGEMRAGVKGVSPKYIPMSSPPVNMMPNPRQAVPVSMTTNMIFPNMSSPNQLVHGTQPNMMTQMGRGNRFISPQIPMQMPQRQNLPTGVRQMNPGMVLSQGPVLRQALYPLQQQQAVQGTILFQNNPQQGLMGYGMRPPF